MVEFAAVIVVEGKYPIPRVPEIIAPNSRSASPLRVDRSEIIVIIFDDEDGTMPWSI